ncbi:hypothetical protein Tco_0971965 [Tanacetum coccineum]
MMFLTTTISSRYPPNNNQLKTSSNPRTQENNQDGRVIVQNVQGRHSEGYTGNAGKEQMNENNKSNKDRIEIGAEKHDFLADGLEGFDSDCEDLQLNTTSILMTEKVEAYDSDCDSTPTASAIFMAKLSPAGSVNGDEAGHSSNSDILSKVPNYDNYHENDMFNSFVQELLASEQSVYVNHTHVDFLSDNNVISDNPYPDNSENEVLQEMTSLAQNDVAILSLIENMQHKVTLRNTVNL